MPGSADVPAHSVGALCAPALGRQHLPAPPPGHPTPHTHPRRLLSPEAPPCHLRGLPSVLAGLRPGKQAWRKATRARAVGGSFLHSDLCADLESKTFPFLIDQALGGLLQLISNRLHPVGMGSGQRRSQPRCPACGHSVTRWRHPALQTHPVLGILSQAHPGGQIAHPSLGRVAGPPPHSPQTTH